MATEITYRFATLSDVDYVAKHMRQDDIAEISAVGMTPKQALEFSVKFSDEAYCACVNGEPSMIFGFTVPMVSEIGEIWALGTDRLFSVPRAMLLEGRRVVKYMLTKATTLHNYIGADNKHSINWLKRLGFTIYEPIPRGVHGEMFRLIEIKRKEK